MPKLPSFEKLAKKLTDCLPDSLGKAKEEMEKNFKSILQGAFSKLDLVTREEFESTEGSLKRARDKLKSLEKRLKALEKS